MESFFIILWMSFPIILLILARVGILWMLPSVLIFSFSVFLWFHVVLMFYIGIPMFLDIIYRPGDLIAKGKFVDSFFSITIFLGSGLVALYWLAFERLYPDFPEKLPFGVKLWALFSKQTMYDARGNVIPNQAVKMPFSNPVDVATNKINEVIARKRAEEMAAERANAKAQTKAMNEAYDLREDQRVKEETRKL